MNPSSSSSDKAPGRRTLVAVVGIAAVLVLGLGATFWDVGAPRRTPVPEAAPRSPVAERPPPRDGVPAAPPPAPDRVPDGVAATVRGRVVRARDGQGVVGARVVDHLESEELVASPHVVNTDAEGRFLLEPREATTHVTAVAPGFLPGTSALADALASGVLELRLHEGSGVDGTVVDDRGAPVSGMTVIATHRSNRVGGLPGARVLAVGATAVCGVATSGLDGSFHVGGLPASGSILLSAAKEGWTSLGSPLDVVADVGSTGVRLVVRPTCRLRIDVVDEKTGSDVPCYALSYRVPQGWREIAQTPRESVRGEWDSPGLRNPQSSAIHLYVGRFAGEVAEQALLEVTLRLSAPGYEDAVASVPVRAGELVRGRVELRAKATDMVNVGFRARTSHGSYEGDLALAIRAPSSVMPNTTWLRFHGGESNQRIRVPSGRLFVACSGAGPAGAWWRPAMAPMTVEVSPLPTNQTHWVELELRGSPVDFTVVAPSGARCHVFDLQVIDASGVGMLYQDWTSLDARSSDADLLARHRIWVGPTARSLRISVPGRGGALVRLVGDLSSGVPTALEVRVAADQETDYAAMLGVFGGGSAPRGR